MTSEVVSDDFSAVIASLVEYSRVTSGTIVELQKNLGQLLNVIDSQGKDIKKLQSQLDGLISREKSGVDPLGPTEVTLDSVLSGADSMRETDEYDILLRKIEARKSELLKANKSVLDVPEAKTKTPKEIEVENAKKMLLERARHHAKMTVTS